MQAVLHHPCHITYAINYLGLAGPYVSQNKVGNKDVDNIYGNHNMSFLCVHPHDTAFTYDNGPA